jgi:NIMA (never in mitosis gene a)-related kinase
MSDEQLKEAFLESKILEQLDHPNIIKFREVYLTNNPRLTMCLVMDYANGNYTI